MIIGRAPVWLRSSALELERLGPWLPPPRKADRRSATVVPAAAIAAYSRGSWSMSATVALERVDGLALVKLPAFTGDRLAARLCAPRPILWACCSPPTEHPRGPYLRPLPGAWGKTIASALAGCHPLGPT